MPPYNFFFLMRHARGDVREVSNSLIDFSELALASVMCMLVSESAGCSSEYDFLMPWNKPRFVQLQPKKCYIKAE